VTGQGGAFELKGVTVSHGGCVYDALLAVAPGFGFAYWSAPTRAFGGEPVVLKLAEERVLKGILVDQSGKPVTGGAVVVSSMRYRTDPNEERVFANLAPPDLFPELAVETDDRGRFEIPNLPNAGEGSVLLSARHGALAACRKTVQVKDFGTQVELTLESRGAIEGRVTYAETGAPAAGVVVAAGPRRSLDGGDKATTGENGRYSIEGVRAGEHRVRIAKENTIEWTASAKSGIKVTAGRATEGVDLALVKGALSQLCRPVASASCLSLRKR